MEEEGVINGKVTAPPETASLELIDARCWKDKDSLTLELVPLNHWANSFQGTHVVNLEKRDEYL